jgi:hypothetical protein
MEMYDEIEEQIQEEARKRAVDKMEGFEPPLAKIANHFGLSPERSLDVVVKSAGVKGVPGCETSLRLTLPLLDEQLEEFFLKAITDQIADQLRKAFVLAAADIDVTTLK